MLGWLQNGLDWLRPLTVAEVRIEPQEIGGRILDAILVLTWKGRHFGFGVEAKALSTPKIMRSAIDQARAACREGELHPLVFLPYIQDQGLQVLIDEEVSGFDMCGNGVLIVPGELFVYHRGFPNKYPRSAGIKNIYRRESSIGAAVFLLRAEFRSVGEVLKEIHHRGGELTLATVSKVCIELENDLIIERKREPKFLNRRLRLLQPEKLLDLLERNYKLPEFTRVFEGKSNLSAEGLRGKLEEWARATGNRVVRTGADSVRAYAAMARGSEQSFYCSDLESALRWLGSSLVETSRFADVEIRETRARYVYFDQQEGLTASPIQVYLELMQGDKRDQETAGQVRRLILQKLREYRPAEGV
ncbi:MAG: hypothetical protein ACLP7Q_08890 [Isosphaeraceae bacterium]